MRFCYGEGEESVDRPVLLCKLTDLHLSLLSSSRVHRRTLISTLLSRDNKYPGDCPNMRIKSKSTQVCGSEMPVKQGFFSPPLPVVFSDLEKAGQSFKAPPCLKFREGTSFCMQCIQQVLLLPVNILPLRTRTVSSMD